MLRQSIKKGIILTYRLCLVHLYHDILKIEALYGVYANELGVSETLETINYSLNMKIINKITNE